LALNVPVKEEFNGQTVWEGIVEVFSLWIYRASVKWKAGADQQ